MNISAPILSLCCDCPLPRAENWRDAINEAMATFDIDNGDRIAAFLAQIAHESGRLVHVRELWGTRPTTAQQGYEGRVDLGNTHTGDGFRYRGRGLVQITGRANYAAARDNLRRRLGDEVPDFVFDPQKLEVPRWAAMSAADFWHRKGLNELADEGAYERITRRINGGLNGYSDRLTLWAGARAALGLEPTP